GGCVVAARGRGTPVGSRRLRRGGILRAVIIMGGGGVVAVDERGKAVVRRRIGLGPRRGGLEGVLAEVSDVTLTTGGLSEWNPPLDQQGPGQPRHPNKAFQTQ